MGLLVDLLGQWDFALFLFNVLRLGYLQTKAT